MTAAHQIAAGSQQHANSKLFFIHIPKTAGTSVRRIVRRQYPADRFIPIYSHDPAELRSVRKQVTNARVFYGHFSYGFHDLIGTRGRYVALLRDPVARVHSLYHHQLNNPRASHHALVNSGPTLVDLLESNAIHEFNNHMTRVVSGHVGVGRLDDNGVLARAIENIERDFLLVGLVERLEESVSMLVRVLDWHQTLPMPMLNVGKGEGVEQLDSATRRAIEYHNRLDAALYRWAAARFDRQ